MSVVAHQTHTVHRGKASSGDAFCDIGGAGFAIDIVGLLGGIRTPPI